MSSGGVTAKALYHLIRPKRNTSSTSSVSGTSSTSVSETSVSDRKSGLPKRSDSNCSSSDNGGKESLWQKASSLRQSLRHRSKHHRTETKRHSETTTKDKENARASPLRREWSSHRDLSREKRRQKLGSGTNCDQVSAHSDQESVKSDVTVLQRRNSKSWVDYESNPPQFLTAALLKQHAAAAAAAAAAANHAGSSSGSDITLTEVNLPDDDLVRHHETRNMDYRSDIGDACDGHRVSSSASTLVDSPLELPGRQRSARKLTKDSGYETSVQTEPDYVNSEWVSTEKRTPSFDSLQSPSGSMMDLSASRMSTSSSSLTHWEQSASLHRSYSYSRDHHSLPPIATTNGYSVLKTFADAPSIHQQPLPKACCIPPAFIDDMGTRRFKKGSVYQTLANKSGLDFAPVVHRINWEQKTSVEASAPNNLGKDEEVISPRSTSPTAERTDSTRLATHEKYPSWPAATQSSANSEATASTARSHSWVEPTDYPKVEKPAILRPKKSFKLQHVRQLPAVLEQPKQSSVFETQCDKVNDDEKNGKTGPEAYLKRYDEMLNQYEQNWPHTDTPLLDRLCRERERHGWSAAQEAAISETSTYIESIGSSGGSSSNDTCKWHDSYSDLSAVSLSNRSSLFDSGLSTLPDSGRLSPQSSCDGSIIGTNCGERIVSKLNGHRETVVHSAKIQPPKRHESESVLYFNALNNRDKKTAPRSRSSTASNASSVFNGADKAKVFSKTVESETHQKLLYLDRQSKQQVTDPELKLIQKQAVLSFYQRQKSQQNTAVKEDQNEEDTSKMSHVQPVPIVAADVAHSVKVGKHPEIAKKLTSSLSASHVLDDETPPQLPPKLFKSAELLHGICKKPRDFSNNSAKHTNGSSAVLSPKDNEVKTQKPFSNVHGTPPRKNKIISPKPHKDSSKSRDQHLSKKCDTVTNGLTCRSKPKKPTRPTPNPPEDSSTPLSVAERVKKFESPLRKEDESTPSGYQEEMCNLKGNDVFEDGEEIELATPLLTSEVTLTDCDSEPKRISSATSPTVRKATLQLLQDHDTNRAALQVVTTEGETVANQDLKEKNDNQVLARFSDETCNFSNKATTKERLTRSSCSSDASTSSSLSSPELPLPPPPPPVCFTPHLPDDPLPPPPEDLTNVYPKNSYMSYRSERQQFGRLYGFDGNYRRPSSSPSSSHSPSSSGTPSPTSSTQWPPEDATTSPLQALLNNNNNNCVSPTALSSPENELASANSSGLPPTHAFRNPRYSLPPTFAGKITRPQYPPPALPAKPIHFSSNNGLSNNNCTKSQQQFNPVPLKNGNMLNGSSSVNNINNNNFQQYNNTLNRAVVHPVRNTDLNSNSRNIISKSAEELKKEITALPIQSQKLSSPECMVTTATQTSDTPRLCRKHVKSKTDGTENSGEPPLTDLVRVHQHRTASDYMEGLYDKNSTEQSSRTLVSSPSSSESNGIVGSSECCTSPMSTSLHTPSLPAHSAYFTISESKARFLNRLSDGRHQLLNDMEAALQREELISSISQKLELLRREQISLSDETRQNDSLGASITNRIRDVARQNEFEKYLLYVEETDKILNLLLSLSGRLARVQNALAEIKDEGEEKRALEVKRDKLSGQHCEARRLKESIDRRSQQVSTFLRNYLTREEFADYEHYISAKARLLVDTREISDKIQLGEEQLNALLQQSSTSDGGVLSWPQLHKSAPS